MEAVTNMDTYKSHLPHLHAQKCLFERTSSNVGCLHVARDTYPLYQLSLGSAVPHLVDLHPSTCLFSAPFPGMSLLPTHAVMNPPLD